MPPKVVLGDETMNKVLLESLFQMQEAGNKPELRKVCATLGLSYETWRKKMPAAMKEYEANRGADGASSSVAASASGDAPKTPKKTPAKRVKATTNSNPRKRVASAKGKGKKKANDEDEDDDDVDSAVFTPTASVERPKRTPKSKVKPAYAEESASEPEESDDYTMKTAPKSVSKETSVATEAEKGATDKVVDSVEDMNEE